MSRTTQWLLLLVILMSAVSLRFWRIDTLPPGFYIDEADEGLEAWHILTNPTYRPLFLTSNSGVDPLNSYANALTFAVFRFFGGDVGPVAMQVTAGCFGVLGVWALYGLAGELQQLDQKTSSVSAFPLKPGAFPFFSAATLAVMRWHFHFSRIGIEPILAPLLWAASLWLFLRGWRMGAWGSFVGSGVGLAAAMYAYQGAWIIPFLMIPVTLLLLFQKWRKPTLYFLLGSRQYIGFLLTVVVASLLFAPLGMFFWQHLDWVIQRPAEIAVSDHPGFVQNLWATVKMYGPFGAPGDASTRRNLPGAPALNLWLALPFYFGLGLALWRSHRPAYAMILIALAAMLLLGMMSNNVLHFHRLLGATAPTALLCAIGLDWIWQWRGRAPNGILWLSTEQLQFPNGAFSASAPWAFAARPLLNWASIFLLILGGATATREYFVRWANLPNLYSAFEAGLWQSGQQIVQLPPGMPIYLTPRGLDRSTVAFALQTKLYPEPAMFNGQYLFPFTATTSPNAETYVVLTQEDKRTAQWLAEFLPKTTLAQKIRDPQGKLYAQFYTRPPNTTPLHPPQYPVSATALDGLLLLGYDLASVAFHSGETLDLRLHWLVQAQPTNDWKVFTHLLRKVADKTTLVAGQDSQRGRSSLHSQHWRVGWRVVDEHKIKLPADLQPSVYELAVGLYQTKNNQLLFMSPALFHVTMKIA